MRLTTVNEFGNRSELQLPNVGTVDVSLLPKGATGRGDWVGRGESSDRGEADTRAGGPCVYGLWLGGVSVSVRRASEERECVMSSEYERRWNNDSSEQSQKHPDPAGGGSSGWLSVVPARDSQGERRAIVSGKEDKKIGEAHSSSSDVLHRGSTPRLGRCERGETEGWMAARWRGRGGESPLETRRETHRGESNSGCEVCEAEENIERTCGVNSCPAVAQAGATADAHESRSMCVTSSTEGQIRTLPEPPLDGATYVPRVSSAAHIDPPDVADVEGVAPAGSAQGEGESPGGRACYMYMYVPTTRRESTYDTQDDAPPTSPSRGPTSTCRPRGGGAGLRHPSPR